MPHISTSCCALICDLIITLQIVRSGDLRRVIAHLRTRSRRSGQSASAHNCRAGLSDVQRFGPDIDWSQSSRTDCAIRRRVRVPDIVINALLTRANALQRMPCCRGLDFAAKQYACTVTGFSATQITCTVNAGLGANYRFKVNGKLPLLIQFVVQSHVDSRADMRCICRSQTVCRFQPIVETPSRIPNPSRWMTASSWRWAGLSTPQLPARPLLVSPCISRPDSWAMTRM